MGLTSVSRAETKNEGSYFGVLGVENNIDGDFNGGFYIYDINKPELRCYVPKIDSGRGFGIYIGGYNEKMSGEISYIRSIHDTTYLGLIPFDGEFELINIDAKIYAVKIFNGVFKTYFGIGASIPKVVIKNGATDSINIGDAVFSGYGLNLGLGTEIKIHPNLGIDGCIMLRGMRINRVKVLGTELEPTDAFTSSCRSYVIKLNYYF